MLLVILGAACGAPRGETALPGSTSIGAVKLIVSQPGLYMVTAAQLGAQQSIWKTVDPASLRLFLREQEVPVWIEGGTGAFELYFYGVASDSRYTAGNVYWLTAAASSAGTQPMRMSTQKLAEVGGTVQDHYLATINLEKNQVYAPLVEEGDHWLWVSLPAPKTQDFELNLDHVAPGGGSMQLEVWGSTATMTDPDHHLRVLVNGQVVGDESWDGDGWHTLSADVPADVWVEGANTLVVEAPDDTGAVADITLVNRFSITYPRQAVASDQRLDLTSAGGSVQVSGLNGPWLAVDITDPQAPIWIAEADKARTAGIWPGAAGRRYWLVSNKGLQKPDEARLSTAAPDLRLAGTGADYVAIGPADLLAAAQPLLDWHTAHGLKALAVPLEAVYDQFNHGFPEPEAIQALLKYAQTGWQPAPRFLLLLGDATYDPLNYQAPPEANRLPVFFVYTEYGGETASDVLFADLNDDLKPELAVGRLPARTPEQVQHLVQKTLAYYQSLPGEAWRQRVLAVADGQEPSFQADAQAFLDQFDGRYQTTLYAPTAGTTDGSLMIRNHFNEGYALVGYFGHGSLNMWGKDRLFTTADAATLANPNPPVVINMTCLVGLFTHPKVESLAEVLLWQPGGGAVAVLAPTSLTQPMDQSFLSKPLVEALLANPDTTLGEALLQAQQSIPLQNNPGVEDVMLTFLLQGDPALRLALETTP
jgi:hypothetical protein